MIKDFLVSSAPSLGVVKRRFHALVMSALPKMHSYSQHGEDVAIQNMLTGYNLGAAIYVDVGANHPVKISNTYLFYRLGHHGVTIDANAEMIGLHKQYRSKDLSLCLGCGEFPKLSKFSISKAPVLSSFRGAGSALDRNYVVWKEQYVPILTLDSVLSAITWEWIFLLNVDVEGMDLEVLKGGNESMERVFLLCIEVNDVLESEKLKGFMRLRGFRAVLQCGCNIIFRNESSWFNQYKRNCV